MADDIHIILYSKLIKLLLSRICSKLNSFNCILLYAVLYCLDLTFSVGTVATVMFLEY